MLHRNTIAAAILPFRDGRALPSRRLDDPQIADLARIALCAGIARPARKDIRWLFRTRLGIPPVKAALRGEGERRKS